MFGKNNAATHTQGTSQMHFKYTYNTRTELLIWEEQQAMYSQKSIDLQAHIISSTYTVYNTNACNEKHVQEIQQMSWSQRKVTDTDSKSSSKIFVKIDHVKYQWQQNYFTLR